MFLNKNLLFVVTTETWRKIKDGVVIGAVARHWTTPVGGQTLLVFRNNTATANAAVTTWIWNSKMSAEIHRNCKICSEQSAADLTNAWFLRGPGQLCSYGQSPSKDTVQSGGGGGGYMKDRGERKGDTERKPPEWHLLHLVHSLWVKFSGNTPFVAFSLFCCQSSSLTPISQPSSCRTLTHSDQISRTPSLSTCMILSLPVHRGCRR